MLITRQWLEDNSPCADGGSWGTDFVGPMGRELEDCIPAMERPDWLIWLLAFAANVEVDKLHLIVLNTVGEEITHAEAKDFMGELSEVLRRDPPPSKPSNILFSLAVNIESSSYALALAGKSKESHALNAVAYLARMSGEYFRLTDAEGFKNMLHRAQAALVQLAASKPISAREGFNRYLCQKLRATL